MKNLSVKEAAEALGVTTRTIQYKLQNGDLKGNRVKNQYGVSEWRIWPNKEILAAMAAKSGGRVDDLEQMNFEPQTADDTVEAIEVEQESFDERSSWRDIEMERLELMAEKLVKPLAERIETQAVALREQEKVIEEQNRQLRLLPDLKKQADEEHSAAELRALEVEALKRQIEAMSEEKARLEIQANEAASLAKDLDMMKGKVEQLEKPWWKKLFGPPPEGNM